jgi:cation diffusion facilitator CzcD-associated flavoprotein CzcO
METRVIVIGAGWTGLAAAKTYLEARPDVSLTIIDEDTSVGGVWSASRVYPGFIADSTAAIFDYSDFPMDAELGVDKWADLPAERVHAYLERYVDKFDLRKRCRLGTKVVRIEKCEGTKEKTTAWKVEVERETEDEESVKESLTCDKLIMATGINSTPNLPSDIDWSTFDGPILHSKDVGTKHHLLTSESVRRVTVVGGNKSAVDVVNMCALAGKEVDWVIRKEGYGPGILFEARTHGIHIGAIEAIRASSIPSPNILSSTGFWYWFLHSGKSKIGSGFQSWLMAKLSESALKEYEGSENTMKIAPDMKK